MLGFVQRFSLIHPGFRCQEVFSGTPPSCVQTTTVTTMTSTMTELVACSGGLPTDRGVNVNDCFGKVNGQTCTVSCMATFQGEAFANSPASVVVAVPSHSVKWCWASFLPCKVQVLYTHTHIYNIYLSICLSVYLSIYLSVCLSIYLYIYIYILYYAYFYIYFYIYIYAFTAFTVYVYTIYICTHTYIYIYIRLFEHDETIVRYMTFVVLFHVIYPQRATFWA